MIPALASVILAYGIIATGLSQYRQAAVGIIGGGSAAHQWNFEPNFLESVRQGTWSIFVTGDDSYNRVLWTMQYEFLGSFIIFAILILFGKMKRKHRLLLYAGLLVASFGSWYAGFVIGLVIADNYKKIIDFAKTMKNSARRCWIAVLVIGGIFLGGYPMVATSSSVYSFLRVGGISDAANVSNYLSLGAGMLVIGVLTSKTISRILSHPRVSILGKYTYSLYLTHMLVILSLTTLLFVLLSKYIGYNKSVVLAVLITMPVIILVTRLFYKYIDRTSLKLSSKLSNLVIE